METNSQYYRVIDNLIHPIQQQQLEKIIYSNDQIHWRYQHNFERRDESFSVELRKNDENILKPNCGIFFLNLVENNKIISEYFETFSIVNKAVMTKFNVEIKNLLRMRINLVMPYHQVTDKYTTPHFDYPGPTAKTVIYYITGTEGDTALFEETDIADTNVSKKTLIGRIEPKKGRAVIFDSHRYHAMCMPNKNIRSVINLIFE